jgi:hypothetical protein
MVRVQDASNAAAAAAAAVAAATTLPPEPAIKSELESTTAAPSSLELTFDQFDLSAPRDATTAAAAALLESGPDDSVLLEGIGMASSFASPMGTATPTSVSAADAMIPLEEPASQPVPDQVRGAIATTFTKRAWLV